jgi:hypothetical protein
MGRERVLEMFKRGAKQRQGVAVFDLDSTLFNTGPRNFFILREFADIYPELHPVLDGMDAHRMGYNLAADLEARGVKDSEILHNLKGFWRERFFTDAYVEKDEPYPGALSLVQLAVNAGLIPYYLTGRDLPNMYKGTVESLRKHGFPMEGAVLRMKPRWEDDDATFKQEVIGELEALGEVLVAFENEPYNANLFKRAFPDAVVVLHETICAPNPPPLDPGVLCMDSFAPFEGE